MSDKRKQAIVRMAADPEFAERVRREPEAVAAELGLAAEDIDALIALQEESDGGSAPSVLGTRLSKSSLGFGAGSVFETHHDTAGLLKCNAVTDDSHAHAGWLKCDGVPAESHGRAGWMLCDGIPTESHGQAGWLLCNGEVDPAHIAGVLNCDGRLDDSISEP